MTYHYADQRNIPVGPYTVDDLLSLHARGLVRPETYVLAEGSASWQPFATLLAQQRPPNSVPPPPVTPVPALKPGKVEAIAIMSLVAGILNCLGGLGWLVFGLALFLIGVIFTIVPATYLFLVGVFEIIYASKLMGAGAASVRPARHLAILDIVSIIFVNLVPCVLGIVSLVFYADEEAQRFFESGDRPR